MTLLDAVGVAYKHSPALPSPDLRQGRAFPVNDWSYSTSGRAQSVPKRSGTSRLVVACCGTKRHVRAYTNRLTSPLACTDNA